MRKEKCKHNEITVSCNFMLTRATEIPFVVFYKACNSCFITTIRLFNSLINCACKGRCHSLEYNGLCVVLIKVFRVLIHSISWDYDYKEYFK